MEKVPAESPFNSPYIYKPTPDEASMIITTTLDQGISAELKDIIQKDANGQIEVKGSKITMNYNI